MKKRLGFVIAMICLAIFARAQSDEGLRSDVIKRRQAVEKAIGENAMLILFSAPERTKTNDVNYQYRQDNNLYYLAGISQADTTLVLLPGSEKQHEFLFVSDRDPRRETWTGKILSHGDVQTISGVQNIYSSEQLQTFIESILSKQPFDVDRYAPSQEYEKIFDSIQAGKMQVYFCFEHRAGLSDELTSELQFATKIRERFAGVTIRDAWPILTQMRQKKSDYEVAMMRKAIDTSCEAHLESWKAIKPGIWEYEVQSVLEAVYKKRNADWAYPSIIGSGPNATTLHYEASQRQTQAGDLLLMDAGAEYRYYTADVTRTIPVSGKFSPEQAAIYQIVYDAQEACFKMIKPGAKLPEIHLKSVEVIKQGLKRLGLITDTSGDQYKIFYMHGSSHWLGLDVHDAGERWRSMEPGFVFTVEPGIYVRTEALDNLPSTPENEKFKAAVRPAFEKYKNIGVRIEDDVLVTVSGYENLSGKLPRRINEIEDFFAHRK